MLRLTHRYAESLLEYAEEHDFQLVYRQALRWVTQLGGSRAGHENGTAEGDAAAPPLGPFLETVPYNHRVAVLDRFINIARDRLNLVDAEVVTAVPLTQEQRQALEVRLIRMFKKSVNLTVTVDPSLLGGLRVIADDIVIDSSIKRKLLDMKSNIYNEVFSAG